MFTFRLAHQEARRRAASACLNAPEGWIVSIKEATRSLDQNAKLWPMLEDIANQVVWDGERMTKEEWKDWFTAALKKQRMVRGMEGGIVFVGRSTSNMGVKEFSELIALIDAFGTQKGVKWTHQEHETL